MSVTVVAPLASSAEKGTDHMNRSAVVRLVLQPQTPSFPVEVRLTYLEDHARAEAVALAARRGAIAAVTAGGCRPRTDHSAAAVVLTDVLTVLIDGRAVYP